MPKFKDEQGNEVEAFTQAEVEARLAEERTKLEQEHTGKLTTLETTLAEAQAALKAAEERGEDKDGNLAGLRKKVDTAEEKLKEQNERWNNQIKGFRDRSIKNVSRGDVELEKKIQHHYDETLKGIKAETDEQIANKVRQAYQLSQDTDAPDPLMSAVLGGAPNANQQISGGDKDFTPGQKAVGRALGISEADYQKYGSDPRRKH